MQYFEFAMFAEGTGVAGIELNRYPVLLNASLENERFRRAAYLSPVVGNHRPAARCRSVRSSLPGRIIFQVKWFETFCNDSRNYSRTFYEKERIIVQLLSHKS